MHSKRYIVTTLAAALLATATLASAQSAPPAPPPSPEAPVAAEQPAAQALPTVSELDALKLTSAAKDLRIAMLETEKAQMAFQAIWRALQRPGFTLNVETMTYTPVVAPSPPAGTLPPPAPKAGGGGGR